MTLIYWGDKMLALISAIATNEIAIQSSDTVRILTESTGFDIREFISTIIATGIGAWLGVALTLKLNYRLEQNKMKLNTIDQMYLKIRPEMVKVTKHIQALKNTIGKYEGTGIIREEGPVADLDFSKFQKDIKSVVNSVGELVSEVNKYRLAKLILDDYIKGLKIKADNLEEYTDDGINSIGFTQLTKGLEEVNRIILRSEENLENYYLKEIGLYKSREWKTYTRKVKEDIESNRDAIINSPVPLGVRIDLVERNSELD